VIGPATIVKAVGGFLGARSQAKAAMAQARLQKQEFDYNAKIFNEKARATRMAGIEERKLLARGQREALATQKVAFGKTGARIDSGSPLLVQLDQLKRMQYDMNNARRNSLIREKQDLQQADMYTYKGKSALYQGRQEASAIRRAGLYSAIGTLAGGFINPVTGEDSLGKFFKPSSSGGGSGISTMGRRFGQFNPPLRGVGSTGYQGDINIGQAGMIG
tara:strand:+ start:131 stop:784 length:654 start_codon:yes stop_codon:yes gene_type:complete